MCAHKYDFLPQNFPKSGFQVPFFLFFGPQFFDKKKIIINWENFLTDLAVFFGSLGVTVSATSSQTLHVCKHAVLALISYLANISYFPMVSGISEHAY